jgi:hypothetical protein
MVLSRSRASQRALAMERAKDTLPINRAFRLLGALADQARSCGFAEVSVPA